MKGYEKLVLEPKAQHKFAALEFRHEANMDLLLCEELL
jgi:hypothetical protein